MAARSRPLRGRELQKAIIDLAHLHGWRVAHFASVPITRHGKTYYATPVEADGKGWPDLFMVRGHQAIAVEVKGDGDTLREDQHEWLEALEESGIPADVWTPLMWRNGTIEEFLR